MELLHYGLLLVLVAAVIFVVLYFLLHNLTGEEYHSVDGLLVGLITVLVIGILALSLAPTVEYSYCQDFSRSIIYSPQTIKVSLVSCKIAKDTVLVVIGAAILACFGILLVATLLEWGRLGNLSEEKEQSMDGTS